jgi:hypothetical protein
MDENFGLDGRVCIKRLTARGCLVVLFVFASGCMLLSTKSQLGDVDQVILYLLDPRGNAHATDPNVFHAPFGGEYHTLQKKILDRTDSSRIAAAVADAIDGPEPDFTMLCFVPAHGILFRMKNGRVYRVAVCLHCAKISYDLPFEKGMQTMGRSSLGSLLNELMPMDPEFQQRFFPSDRPRSVPRRPNLEEHQSTKSTAQGV